MLIKMGQRYSKQKLKRKTKKRQQEHSSAPDPTPDLALTKRTPYHYATEALSATRNNFLNNNYTLIQYFFYINFRVIRFLFEHIHL